MNIKTVVADFANQLSALIENEATDRARAAVLAAFGAPPRRGPGRPPKSAAPSAPVAKKKARQKARKKAPLQLCPVPGCKNPAAPIFGMVCAKHKGLAKAKIRKYREARRAKKLGLPAPKARRRRVARKATPRKVAKKTPTKTTAKTKPAAAMIPAPAPSPPPVA